MGAVRSACLCLLMGFVTGKYGHSGSKMSADLLAETQTGGRILVVVDEGVIMLYCESESEHAVPSQFRLSRFMRPVLVHALPSSLVSRRLATSIYSTINTASNLRPQCLINDTSILLTISAPVSDAIASSAPCPS